MTSCITLSVMDIALKIFADKTVIDNICSNIDFLKKAIPIISMADLPDNLSEYYIHIQRADRYYLNADQCSLRFAYKDFDLSSFTYSILVPLLSNLMLKHGLLFIHGASLFTGDFGAVIAGKGKSTTVFNLCKSYGYQIVAEDNLILDPINKIIYSDCRTITLDEVPPGSVGKKRKTFNLNELGLQSKCEAGFSKLFYLTAPYDSENIIEVSGYEKAFYLGTFINERLLNWGRWNSYLKVQFPILLTDQDYVFRNKAIQLLMDMIQVYKVESSIKNAYIMIQKVLKK